MDEPGRGDPLGQSTAGRGDRSLRYLLDTTLLADYANGHPGAAQILDGLFAVTSELYVCDVVVCEALAGGAEEQHSALATLLNVLEYVATDPAAARWAGESRRRAHQAGAKRGIGDALIAGVAWRLGATVVTRNVRDFDRQGVPVLTY